MQDYQQKINLLKASIKSIPNYPKPNIIYRDITSLIEDPAIFQMAIDLILNQLKDRNINKIVGVESRGFIFGAPIALALKVPFVLVRKPGKLPRAVISEEYALEYGTDKLEIHADAVSSADNILIVDDLLATGGTIEAVHKLITRLEGKATCASFIIDLPELGGSERLRKIGIEPISLVSFAGH